jgi:hypothetical protein
LIKRIETKKEFLIPKAKTSRQIPVYEATCKCGAGIISTRPIIKCEQCGSLLVKEEVSKNTGPDPSLLEKLNSHHNKKSTNF